jgi:hypothetical protein
VTLSRLEASPSLPPLQSAVTALKPPPPLNSFSSRPLMARPPGNRLPVPPRPYINPPGHPAPSPSLHTELQRLPCPSRLRRRHEPCAAAPLPSPELFRRR